MMFFSDSNNVTPDLKTVIPAPNNVTPGLKTVIPAPNNVTPGLTRGPFSKLAIGMKNQNGFRIRSGMTCAMSTNGNQQ
jgi:hypothetical protein